ncbi:MAG: cell division protein FtsA [Opitutae bacterium]|nr:cell division protein FtsA [Opitutae bacterium]|tara:strand:+ start:777 stop:1973 length:1197 start_codon:yes stop_codon:yes gene_type:complete
MNKIIAAVEIGTSKMKVLLGEIRSQQALNVVGFGSIESFGVKKGELVNFKVASEQVHLAIDLAEKSAGVQAEEVYLSVTGSHLGGSFNLGSARVSSADNVVVRNDVARAIEEAKRKELLDDRIYVHFIQNPFHLDGRPVEDPLNLQGSLLEVGYWSVDGDEKVIKDLLHVINGYGLEVGHVIASSLASGEIATSRADRKAGALVIDFGAGATDYVLYRDGCAAKTGVVPIGGDHLTNDISMGLRVDERHAESLKKEHGRAFCGEEDDDLRVWLIGNKMIGDRDVSRKAIRQVVAARVEELFQILAEELEGYLEPDHLGSGIHLTGGGSLLPGITEVASSALGLPAKRAELPTGIVEELRNPEFATVLGLLHFGLTGQSQVNPVRSKGIGRALAKIFGR